jgi:hypothetical protein
MAMKDERLKQSRAATKEAVEEALNQSGTVRDSQASEGGGRFTERRGISVSRVAKIREER